MEPSKTGATTLGLLTLASLCMASAASAQSPAPGPDRSQGLTVVRDADTGRLRAPTPAELQALQRKGPTTLQGPARPVMITGADGRRQVRLGERGLVYAVVKRGADGQLDRHCVQGAEAAKRALAQAVPDAGRQEAYDAHR